MLVWFFGVSLKIVVISHPYSIWQAEDANRLYWAITQHWAVAVNTNETAEKLVNLHNIFVQIKKEWVGKKNSETLLSEVHCSRGYFSHLKVYDVQQFATPYHVFEFIF